jgi:hypothetical protein
MGGLGGAARRRGTVKPTEALARPEEPVVEAIEIISIRLTRRRSA